MPREILIEGLVPESWVNLTPEEMDALVLNDEPVVFRAGTATVLGRFTADADVLRVELAHMDGGGEGVLRTLHRIAHAVAVQRGLTEICWTVHSANCARPNPKLNRVLQRIGFQLEETKSGPTYRRKQPVNQ